MEQQNRSFLSEILHKWHSLWTHNYKALVCITCWVTYLPIFLVCAAPVILRTLFVWGIQTDLQETPRDSDRPRFSVPRRTSSDWGAVPVCVCVCMCYKTGLIVFQHICTLLHYLVVCCRIAGHGDNGHPWLFSDLTHLSFIKDEPESLSRDVGLELFHPWEHPWACRLHAWYAEACGRFLIVANHRWRTEVEFEGGTSWILQAHLEESSFEIFQTVGGPLFRGPCAKVAVLQCQVHSAGSCCTL